MISVLRQLGDLEGTRQARIRLNSILLLKVSDWIQWINDEIAIVSGEIEDKLKVKELFEIALKDYPASIDLWLEYLTFCRGNPEITEDINKEISKASAFAAWNLQEGFKILQQLPISNPRAIPYTSRAKRSMNFEDVSPSLFEVFEETFPKNIENYVEAVKSSKFISSSDKLTLCRVIFERAIEKESNPQIWDNYLKFLRSEMNVSSVILNVNRRLTRAHPLLVDSWINLLENLELFGQFDEVQKVWTGLIPKILFKKTHETFLSLHLTNLDFLRRQGKKEELFLAFQNTIYDEEKMFGLDPQERLSRYFAQTLLKEGEIEKFRNVWQQLLKQHAKEAGFWLEYLQMERSLLLKQGHADDCSHVINGFKRAVSAVSDYPETIFYEWIQFERQRSSSLQSVLDARDRIDKQRKLLKERETQRQAKEHKEKEKEINYRKRSRIEPEVTEPMMIPSQPIKSFNPAATLFVNNLPFSFSENDIKKHFENLLNEFSSSDINGNSEQSVKSIRMHMNSSGKGFKGHATIEFDCPDTANTLLETFNRRPADESGRPVFLAKYVSPLEKKTNISISNKTESDAKTLYISNLPVKETIQVENLFQSLRGVKQIRHLPGKQFGFVEFESEELAQEALKGIPQIDSRINAAFSNPPSTTIPSKPSSIALLKPRSISLKK